MLLLGVAVSPRTAYAAEAGARNRNLVVNPLTNRAGLSSSDGAGPAAQRKKRQAIDKHKSEICRALMPAIGQGHGALWRYAVKVAHWKPWVGYVLDAGSQMFFDWVAKHC